MLWLNHSGRREENKRFPGHFSESFNQDCNQRSTQKVWISGAQNVMENWKSFADLKEYTFTVQLVRLTLFLRNVQRALRNFSPPLKGRKWIQIFSQKISIRFNLEFRKRLFDRLYTEEYQELRLFVHSDHEPLLQHTKPNVEHRHKVRISTIDSTFREVCRTRLVQNFFRMIAMASRKPQYTQRRMNRLSFYVGFLSKNSLLRPFDNGTLHKRVSFSCICTTTLR